MFVKAGWIAIVAALCVTQTHAAQEAKLAKAEIGTSTLIRDANGKAIGSAASYYDVNGTFIRSETTYYTPAPTPVVANAAVKPADASAKPSKPEIGTSTLIRDANGKAIGSAASYYDVNGTFIRSETTYYTPAPAAVPAVAGAAVKPADAPAKPVTAGTSTLIRDANGKATGSAGKYCK